VRAIEGSGSAHLAHRRERRKVVYGEIAVGKGALRRIHLERLSGTAAEVEHGVNIEVVDVRGAAANVPRDPAAAAGTDRFRPIPRERVHGDVLELELRGDVEAWERPAAQELRIEARYRRCQREPRAVEVEVQVVDREATGERRVGKLRRAPRDRKRAAREEWRLDAAALHGEVAARALHDEARHVDGEADAPAHGNLQRPEERQRLRGRGKARRLEIVDVDFTRQAVLRIHVLEDRVHLRFLIAGHDGDAAFTGEPRRVADQDRLGAPRLPGDAERTVVEGERGVADRDLLEIAQRPATVRPYLEVLQQNSREILAAGALAESQVDGAVGRARHPELRLGQHDARRRDFAHEDGPQTEI